METPPPVSPGFMAALGKLGDGLIGGVQTRIELFSVELQEEKFRLIQTFIWISAAVFTGVMALTFASLSLVYLFWESARLGVLIGLTLFYTSALLVLIVAFRRYIARQPKPFAATLAELETDRACIRNPS
jgi:uncharacterized membrane protein YqjE